MTSPLPSIQRLLISSTQEYHFKPSGHLMQFVFVEDAAISIQSLKVAAASLNLHQDRQRLGCVSKQTRSTQYLNCAQPL
jgi:hypothetical protein